MTKSKKAKTAEEKRRQRFAVLAEKRRERRIRRNRERYVSQLNVVELGISACKDDITKKERALAAIKRGMKKLELKRAVLQDRLK